MVLRIEVWLVDPDFAAKKPPSSGYQHSSQKAQDSHDE